MYTSNASDPGDDQGQRRWRHRQSMAVGIVAVMLGLTATPVSAGTVDSKRSEAARIAKQRESLITQSERLNE